MCSITLYDQPFLKGKSMIFNEDVVDLSTYAFFKVTRSLTVVGKPWVAFEGANYRDDFRIYKPGDHHNLGDFTERIASVQEVKVSLENPEIVLYEDVYYNGKSVSIINETEDVKAAGLQDKVSSHKVKRGAWILYMDPEFRGARLFTMKDEPNYLELGWNDRLSSLKPVTKDDFQDPTK